MNRWIVSLSLALGSAAASVPDAPEFGVIGGAPGQVMRISVYAVEPALVSAFYQDMLGRTVSTPKLIVLKPGETDWFELNFALVGRGRSYVRPIVKYLEGSGRATFVAEMYDTVLGRTTTGAFGINFLPAVQFGPVGLAYGQIMRLGIGAHSPGGGGGAGLTGCTASIGFRRSNGTVIDPNEKVVLSPGQWAYVELDSSKHLRPGQRNEFLPAVQMDPEAKACTANVQVYDALTGWTTVYVPGAINF